MALITGGARTMTVTAQERSSGAHDDDDGALKRVEGQATTAILCWSRIAHDNGDGMLE